MSLKCVWWGSFISTSKRGLISFLKAFLTNFECFLFFQGVLHRKPWRRGVKGELDLLLGLEKDEGEASRFAKHE